MEWISGVEVSRLNTIKNPLSGENSLFISGASEYIARLRHDLRPASLPSLSLTTFTPYHGPFSMPEPEFAGSSLEKQATVERHKMGGAAYGVRKREAKVRALPT